MTGPGSYWFGDEERDEVLEVLSSGHLSRYGNLEDPQFKHKVYDFERAFADHCGAARALATSSGTASLLIALLALGIHEGDEVLVPGFAYIATFAAVVFTRAVPVLVEVDESLTIDTEDLERKITDRSRVILPVHMMGNPCDMDAIRAIAERHGLHIVEDACQAVGASFRGTKVGTFGIFGVFSLNRYKMITVGEGGVLVTDDSALHERAFALHDQGHLPVRSSKIPPEQALIGLNFKMSEITGAIALAQLRKLDPMLARLRRNKRLLREMIPELPGLRYRRINDAEGECATLLTVIFEDQQHARVVAQRLGSCTLTASGWHNYQHMTHIAGHRAHVDDWSASARFAAPGELPQTDDLLARSINISVGVVDPGLASEFGIDINSTEIEIAGVARRFSDAVRAGVSRLAG